MKVFYFGGSGEVSKLATLKFGEVIDKTKVLKLFVIKSFWMKFIKKYLFQKKLKLEEKEKNEIIISRWRRTRTSKTIR